MSKITNTIQNNPMAQAFLEFIEEETKLETEKIVKSYQEKMEADLELARSRIVAKAGVRLSELMSIQDLGRTVRIEITKLEQP